MSTPVTKHPVAPAMTPMVSFLQTKEPIEDSKLFDFIDGLEERLNKVFPKENEMADVCWCEGCQGGIYHRAIPILPARLDEYVTRYTVDESVMNAEYFRCGKDFTCVHDSHLDCFRHDSYYLAEIMLYKVGAMSLKKYVHPSEYEGVLSPHGREEEGGIFHNRKVEEKLSMIRVSFPGEVCSGHYSRYYLIRDFSYWWNVHGKISNPYYLRDDSASGKFIDVTGLVAAEKERTGEEDRIRTVHEYLNDALYQDS